MVATLPQVDFGAMLPHPAKTKQGTLKAGMDDNGRIIEGNFNVL